MSCKDLEHLQGKLPRVTTKLFWEVKTMQPLELTEVLVVASRTPAQVALPANMRPTDTGLFKSNSGSPTYGHKTILPSGFITYMNCRAKKAKNSSL
jgi:hypothetical protein